VDSLWVIVCACLVFFMHAGFALVESGFSRRKNAVMVLLKNVTVLALSSLVFYAVGYGIMFGEGNAFIGLSMFAPDGSGDVGGLPTFVFLFFQLVFAATAATIVSGAVAERARLGTFIAFTALATAVLYPIVGHWVWGGGWLSSMGFHDFAGSTVVHAVGGGMALAGAIVVGPRLGRYAEGRATPMPAHSLPLATLGVLILWLGWFGFNGGSTLSADAEAIGPVILVTNLAAAAGFLAALVHSRLRSGGLDLSMALNGALAGLVGITAGADVIGPIGAMVVGLLCGVAVVEGVLLLDRLKVDDPVGAIPVHLFCGLLGTLAVGVFANSGETQGVLHGGPVSFLGVQALGAFASAGFAVAAGGLVWFAMKQLPGGVRVSEEHEREGLDLSECGVEAYAGDLFGVSEAEAPQESPAALAPIAERAESAS